MAPTSPSPRDWIPSDAFILHHRMDALCTWIAIKAVPLTTEQARVMGELHEYFMNIDGEMAHGAIKCQYLEWLSEQARKEIHPSGRVLDIP